MGISTAKKCIIFSSLLILILPMSQAFAQISSGDGGGDTTDAGDFDFNQDVVLEVIYDPNAGPILKEFPGFPQLTQIQITEVITNRGPIPITDWHEEAFRVGTADKSHWVGGVVHIGANQFPCNTMSSQGNSIHDIIWCDFPPVGKDQSFTVVKEVIHQSVVTGGQLVLGVLEHPTSTPPPRMQVGGQMINVDSTSLILAGGQMTAAWILPVLVAGAGFAIVIARKI